MATLEEQFRTRLNGFVDDTGMAPTTLGMLGAALPAGLSFDASKRTIGGTPPTACPSLSKCIFQWQARAEQCRNRSQCAAPIPIHFGIPRVWF